MIIRFTSWYSRNELYSARKDFRYRLRADLTSRRQQIKDYALDYVNNNNHQDLVDFVAADRNCRLVLRTTAGKFHSFSSEQEFRNIIDNLTSPDYTDEYRDVKAFSAEDLAMDKKKLDKAKQIELLNFMAANNATPSRSPQPRSSTARSTSPPPSPSKPTTSSTSSAATPRSSISSTGL